MENETKYPLVIIGVALLALVAFNYDDISTGAITLQNSPTTYPQESLKLVRNVDVPNSVPKGSRVEVVITASSRNDLIQTSKEKIVFYEEATDRFKYQLTYPKCIEGRSSSCTIAEKSYSIPPSWSGKYRVQVEREARVDGKLITEVIGRSSFNIK
tara:strand:- start:1150 stop:1617 length:468 start_codon:yes stop_codon:yes gene_type:complete